MRPVIALVLTRVGTAIAAWSAVGVMAVMVCTAAAHAEWPANWPFAQPEEGWFFYRETQPPVILEPDDADASDDASTPFPKNDDDQFMIIAPSDTPDDEARAHTPSSAADDHDADERHAASLSGPALEAWLSHLDDTTLESVVAQTPASALRTWIPVLLDQALTTLDRPSVRKYLLVQQESLRRSDRFSKLWQEVVWTDPAFDRPGSMPLGSTAQAIYEEDRTRMERETLASLSTQVSLLLVVAPQCRTCEAQWRTLQSLKNDYGFATRPIASELLTLSDSSLALPYPGIIRTLAPRELPSLYALSTATGEIVRLGSGLLAQDEILTRLLRLFTQPPSKGAHSYALASPAIDNQRDFEDDHS